MGRKQSTKAREMSTARQRAGHLAGLALLLRGGEGRRRPLLLADGTWQCACCPVLRAPASAPRAGNAPASAAIASTGTCSYRRQHVTREQSHASGKQRASERAQGCCCRAVQRAQALHKSDGARTPKLQRAAPHRPPSLAGWVSRHARTATVPPHTLPRTRMPKKGALRRDRCLCLGDNRAACCTSHTSMHTSLFRYIDHENIHITPARLLFRLLFLCHVHLHRARQRRAQEAADVAARRHRPARGGMDSGARLLRRSAAHEESDGHVGGGAR